MPDETKIVVSTIQTLNVVPQKVIQVNKPAGYYGDQDKTVTADRDAWRSDGTDKRKVL